ncbi:MAG: histidyl-tRNA synthetase [Patiriisocius sp.]|jgi:histidyl-tRNA synthetase
MAKPSNAKGTRDFIPLQMTKRSFIFDTIRDVFVQYGYQCIETPAVEKSETLTGKYGEEGDRLIFKILDSGDFAKKADLNEPSSLIAKKISTRALRYDLTVPFARFVTQHKEELVFPFKRFQIQPVWRADRPQKGRYREFFQCDADVVGSDSLLFEIEQIQILNGVLSKLGISHIVHVNNRKILQGIAEVCGEPDKLVDITIALDKLDKIGIDGVKKELINRGLSDQAMVKIEPFFTLDGNWDNKVEKLNQLLTTSEIGLKGLEEINFVFSNVIETGFDVDSINFNITLARGLSYYTGAIFEVTTDVIKIGSICGGGRYDNLTELFGLSGNSGVGISFGADRIYDVMEEASLWPETLSNGTDLLIINFDDKYLSKYLSIQKMLISSGFSCEIYPDALKMGKQMKYANDKKISFVAMLGDEELSENNISIKNMFSGEQKTIPLSDLVKELK